MVGDSGETFHPPKRSPMPFKTFNMKVGHMFGRYELNRNKLVGYTKMTKEGTQQAAIGLVKHPDIASPSYFKDTQFIDCDQNSIDYMFTPDPKWAIIKDCGNWPCSGPLNAIHDFKRSTFSGTKNVPLVETTLGQSF